MRGLGTLLPLLVGVMLAGCGFVSEDGKSFEPALIDEVGAGSVALQRIGTTLDPARLPGTSADERYERVVTLILQGRLDRIGAADLRHIDKVNDRAEHRFKALLGELTDLEIDIRDSLVVVESHPSLSPGARRFVSAWNSYLNENAARIRRLRRALTSIRPLMALADNLVLEIRRTARVQSTDAFERMRVRFLRTTAASYERLRKAATSVFSVAAADEALIELVNHNREAQVIVAKVNDGYPDGLLARAVTPAD